MRIALVWFAVWFGVASSAHAQSVPAYSLLRENEDWSFLRDTSLRQDIWDPLKYIRLGSEDWYLTIGGEVRLRRAPELTHLCLPRMTQAACS